MYNKAKKYAEAIVSDMVIDDEHGAECLSCNSFGEYPDRISHVGSCIVLDAKNFLETKDDG